MGTEKMNDILWGVLSFVAFVLMIYIDYEIEKKK